MDPTPATGRRTVDQGSRALATLVAWLIAAPGAGAGTVTLLTRTTCSPAAQEATCRVEIENQGDEKAIDLDVAVALAGRPEARRSLGALAPGEAVTARIVLPLAKVSGQLPVILRLRYLDEQGYPLSALSHAWIETVPAGSFPVAARLEPAILAGPGSVEWRLTNEGSKPLTVGVTLLVPDALELDVPRRRVELAPGQTIRESHPLAAGTALPGSRYRVYLLLEQEDAGGHRSRLVPATVTVAAARHAAVLYRRPALIGLVSVAAAACCLQALLAARLAGRRRLWGLG